MSLNTIKVKGDNTVEEGGILREVVGMLRLIVQCRSYRTGRLGHVSFLLALCLASLAQYSIARTHFQQIRARARTRLTTGSNRVACGGLKPDSVKRVHEFYEELGCEEVQAVNDMELAAQKGKVSK